MPSSITVSFLGALQASLSVLFTLLLGVIAARFGILSEKSAKEVSNLCVKLFLPALLIVNVGKELGKEGADKLDYGRVLIWALSYNLISTGTGQLLSWGLKLPSWATPAICFNNTTSLPLLLVQSLATTGFLDKIVTDGSTADAVSRAKSFFLINSLVSNALTFAIGPKLLELEHEADSDSEDNGQDGEAQNDDREADENTSLLPNPVLKRLKRTQKKSQDLFYHHFERLPYSMQKTLSFSASLINPPLVGAIIAAIIGLTPFLHKAFFNKPFEGGIFRGWLTATFENVGELFTSLQMFVVGSKLNQALEKEVESRQEDGDDVETGNVPYVALGVVFFMRFIFWAGVSYLVIWSFASKANVMGSDPILWFSAAIMHVGPPAMMLVSLADVANQGMSTKMAVSKMLGFLYFVTPVICFPVVGALKLTELIMRDRGIKI